MNLFNWRKARGPSLSAEQVQRREQLLPAAAAHLVLVAGRLGLRAAGETSVRARLVEGWRWCRALFAPAAVVRVAEKKAG